MNFFVEVLRQLFGFLVGLMNLVLAIDARCCRDLSGPLPSPLFSVFVADQIGTEDKRPAEQQCHRVHEIGQIGPIWFVRILDDLYKGAYVVSDSEDSPVGYEAFPGKFSAGEVGDLLNKFQSGSGSTSVGRTVQRNQTERTT